MIPLYTMHFGTDLLSDWFDLGSTMIFTFKWPWPSKMTSICLIFVNTELHGDWFEEFLKINKLCIEFKFVYDSECNGF